MSRNPDSSQPFRRGLPGGGYVAIEITPAELSRPLRCVNGRLVVERRTVKRHGRHRPLVIATASGESADEVVDALMPTAQSNSAIGSALLRLARPGAPPSSTGPEAQRPLVAP